MIRQSDEQFCHLHVHTEYSLLDGYGNADGYAKRAAELGFEYLACTDHGNIDGLIKFQKACEKHGVKPLFGCELYMVEDPSKKEKGEYRSHVTVLVQNEDGFRGLCRMLTKANLDGFYYRPRVSFDDLYDNAEGLVVLTGCAQSFLNLEGGIDLLLDLKKRQVPVFLEIMPHMLEAQNEINLLCANLSAKHNIPLIATNDCHYILEEDWKAQDVLLAIQTKAKWNDPKRWSFGIRGLHLATSTNMVDRFKKQAVLKKDEITDALHNTMEVARLCEGFKIKKQNIFLPKVPGFEDKNAANHLKYVSFQALKRLGLERDETYLKRLEDEWEVIEKKGFGDYFNLVYDLVNWCKKNDIMTGPGRGSVGGSLVAYLLGITTIDPIKYDLIFARFISEERIDYPDIDLDFEDRKRHLVRARLEELYGKNNISSISTFLTMKGRAAIRDVARVFEIPAGEVDVFAKAVDNSQGSSDEAIIETAINETVEGKAFDKLYPNEVDLMIKLEGQVRGTGQHAAAVVVSADDLTKGTRGNLAMRSGLVVSNWDMEDSEYVGLMKLDVLGLNTLSILSEVKRLAALNDNKVFMYHEPTNEYLVGERKELENPDLEEIPLDFTKLEPTDERVFKELAAGNTVGVFQINTYAGTKLCKELEVRNFSELGDVLALIRPGPADSGMTDEYVRRAFGKEYEAKHAQYEKIVGSTHGLIVYQEQIMQVINKVAGLPYATADKIRKIIGKKRDVKEFDEYKQAFIDGCLKEGYFDKEEALDFWDTLEKHANYSFNKSHSTAYAMLAYWTAFCKIYYPAEFICASLTYGPETKKEEVIKEAIRLGAEVIPPKVGKSHSHEWRIVDGKLYMPFIEIKGIGEKTAEDCMNVKPTSSTGPKGFFNEGAKPKAGNKIVTLLTAIGAMGNETPKASDVQKYFTFDISNMFNKSGKGYPKLRALTNLPVNGDLLMLDVGHRKIKGCIKETGFRNSNLADCYDCELCSEGQGPVLPSKGRYNVMVLGEAPGKNEDEEGKGFVGRSGDEIWPIFNKAGYEREDFHVTNCCKCYPRVSKTPGKIHLEACRKWLTEEIKELGCHLILAFGNTSLKMLLGKEAGITAKSGTTEWIEDIGAWVCWSIHPSAVLHNPNEKKKLEDGIANFIGKIELLGGFK